MQTKIANQETGTQRLLACGVIAGPLFVSMVLLQGVFREGFRLSFHPLSLLSLGGAGWVQVLNFVVTGLLYVAFSVGLRRALYAGRGRTWAPIMFGLVGAGLMASGVFVTDAGAGFPPGAPEGAPDQINWHGVLHTVGFLVANLGWLVGTLVLMRRFIGLKDRAWAAGSALSVLIVVILVAQPPSEDFALRGLLATAVSFGFTAILAARFRAALAARSTDRPVGGDTPATE